MGGHYPAGSSLKQFLHFAQLISSGRFQKYDYGTTLNKQYYGQELAPEIDISTITKVPIGLFVGSEDELADAEDNVWASQQLAKTLVHYKEYELGHLGFLAGKDMSYFTVDAMNLIKKYHGLPSTMNASFLQ